jgi:DNA (cytosine-5)-methyltransferase 1
MEVRGRMTHGSLFSGIGGFDLASEWMGWENIFHCEWNEFGQRVLKHHFPNSISYGDITTTDFTIHRGQIDILTGGFPCQPYSQAGKRLGKEDDRHLWPEMLRAIREIQPRWVVGENVLGLVNWNGGLVFDEVQADLEAEGYTVQPYVLPACAVNAPHRRDRVWFVAYSMRSGHGGKSKTTRPDKHEEREVCEEIGQHGNGVWGKAERRGAATPDPDGIGCDNGASCGGERPISNNGNGDATENDTTRGGWECGFGKARSVRDASNSNGNGQHGSNGEHEIEPSQRGVDAQRDVEPICGEIATNANASRVHKLDISTEPTEPKPRCGVPYERGDFCGFPTQSPICSGDDGFPTQLDGITFSKWRNESVKAYGNAIVPQVAYQIFQAIHQYECQASPNP